MFGTAQRRFGWMVRGGLILAATVATVMIAVFGSTPSQAADTFDPGLIISDTAFYKSTAMTVGEVEAFIAGKGANCVSGKDGSLCLKTFRQDTTSRSATAKCTAPYVGTGNESAAQIIAKVGNACGINPQVLLVMLQKEQGLVTASGTGLTLTRYQKAMGYACPDTAPCDAQYYGFQNQVYSAAAQLKSYALTPNSWNHRAGAVNNVRFHPDAACGSSAVYIQNQATASLYNYTPYQPNAAALAAGSGNGDTCSSYGNRNFYNYFKLWFGEPLNQAPIGAVDAATVVGTTVTVSGWTLDPDTTNSIEAHIYIDGVGVSLKADLARSDLVPVYNRGPNHGFAYSVSLSPGTHNVCVFGINATPGSNTLIDCRNVNVADAAPIGTIDGITTTASSLSVWGWAIDPDTSAPIQAHVYVDGVGVGLMANESRPDLIPYYNRGAEHGYSYTFQVGPGTHSICAYAINSTPGPNTLIGCKTVSIAAVADIPPIGVLDAVTVAPGAVTFSGWALDQDTTASTETHIYVDGAGVSILANGSRPDLIPYYNRGAEHGFSYTWQLAPGRHSYCVYAISGNRGANSTIACGTVDVP